MTACLAFTRVAAAAAAAATAGANAVDLGSCGRRVAFTAATATGKTLSFEITCPDYCCFRTATFCLQWKLVTPTGIDSEMR